MTAEMCASAISRLDAGGGTVAEVNVCLAAGYQFMGIDLSTVRARHLATIETTWYPYPRQPGCQIDLVTAASTMKNQSMEPKMLTLLDNSKFLAAYERLKTVSLNPAYHAASNAHEHCEMVRNRIIELAKLNSCSKEAGTLLEELAYVHDIGKVSGNAAPCESVAQLHSYGITNETLINLVKYHDINLPWYQATQRGEPPSDKAWNKMARKVDVRLLCLFMVADRVDFPGGWKANQPLIWFLQEAENRHLLGAELLLNEGQTTSPNTNESVEESAGSVLVQGTDVNAQALVIRVRRDSFEVPKGHIETGESKEAAALRELYEETGLLSPTTVLANLGVQEYTFEQNGITVRKCVSYFAVASSNASLEFGEKPERTREIRWVSLGDLEMLPLVNEDLRSIIQVALTIER